MAERSDIQLQDIIYKTKELDIVGDGTNLYEFNAGNICVLIYKQSVTKVEGMDAIVNAASSTLQHKGVISSQILKAAGKEMDDECRQFIKVNGYMSYSDVFVSTPGKMRCKGIIHAAGPRWSVYRRKDKCAKVLYRTIYNCLKVMEQRGWGRIALCSLSSGSKGVPRKLCTAMYMRAIEDFASNNPQSQIEIHFIDVVQEMLDSMIEAHKERVKTGKSLDFHDALKFQN